jgi:CubicO group peptidase (beta-lactamase class C family)
MTTLTPPRPRRPLRCVAAVLPLLLAACTSAPPPQAPALAAPPSPVMPAHPAPKGDAEAQPQPEVTKTPLLEEGISFDGPFRRGEAGALGLDVAALRKIVDEAERTRSDSLIVIKDGAVVVDRSFGKTRGPIETMSATKSVVSLAIGILLAEKRIASIDLPISTWYPDWKAGLKAKVTLRHVLTHTSGLAHGKGAGEMNKQADRSKYVRAAAVTEEPGQKFSYNNEAVQLLAGIIRSAAGEPLDTYVARKLFAPLGITEWQWAKDKASNVQAFYGLALSGRDLAKLGLLMMQKGSWNGQVLVPAAWIEESTRVAVLGTGHGYLWWVRFETATLTTTPEKIAELREKGFGAADKLSPLVGRPFPGRSAGYWMEVGSLLLDAERRELHRLFSAGTTPFVETAGAPMGFAADGWLGQQLIVLPERGVVAVRQHREPTTEQANDDYNTKYGFFELASRLAQAVPRR